MSEAKEKIRSVIRNMAIGESKQITNGKGYKMLIDLYCEGEPFTIDDNKGCIIRESEDFTKRRIIYAEKLSKQ